MGKLLLMSDVEINPSSDKDLIFKLLKDEFHPLDEVWEVEKSDNKIVLTTSLYKYSLNFQDKKGSLVVKVRPSWTSKGYLYILGSLCFFLVPWVLYTAFSLNPKMDKANRRIDRLLKDKFSKLQDKAVG